MAKIVRLINENGNVAAKVRERLKGNFMNAVATAMSGYGMSSSTSADKDLAVYIADDATNGNPIYAYVSVTISQRDPAVKTAKSKTKSKKSKAKPVEDELPDLFAKTDEDEGEDEDEDEKD